MKTRNMKELYRLLSKGYKIKTIICDRYPDSTSVCRPEPSGTPLKVKFWCFVCNRYVLLDKNHFANLQNNTGNNPQIGEQK